MPELPEVETVRRILEPLIRGKTIEKVRLIRPKNCETNPTVFIHDLEGKTFLGISRVGKYLAFHLTGDLVIVSHLRMEGKYFLKPGSDPLDKFDLCSYDFTDGSSLRYNDQRKFGVFGLYKEADYLEASAMGALGKEPYTLSPQELCDGFQKKKSETVKEALLDQSLIAGLGNIYDNEVLFACGINPKTLAKDLDVNDCASLLKESVRILNEALEEGGSTIKSYHPKEGVNGEMQNELLVYGKENQACPKCGMPLRKIFIGGRGSVYCPHCQPYKGHPFILAVTGPIHAGKSTVSGYYEQKGYHRIDADKIVGELYLKTKVLRHVQSLLGKDAVKEGTLDRSYVTAVLSQKKKLKAKLEAYIHPLVLEETKKRIAGYHEGDRIVLDVPLLFGSGLDQLADCIILVLSKDQNRAERLSLEGKDATKSLKLNEGWPIALAKSSASLIVENDGSICDLEKKLDSVKYL
jgi:formamidopyrimidine-DNA glycosylase